MSQLDARQQEIVDEFALLGDWTERYQYLIDLGRQLPLLDAAEQRADTLVDGCQSQVWLLAMGDASALHFRAGSDSAIVAGLVALLLRTYDGLSAAQILATPPAFVAALGLDRHLSPTRNSGLSALYQRIQQSASAALALR